MSQSYELGVFYLDIKKFVMDAGYANEVDWQDELAFEHISESDFLREAGWVVLSSGFRESVVRRRFPLVSEAFLQWRSAKDIEKSRERCESTAFVAFRNRRKIGAIGAIVSKVASEGFGPLRTAISRRGVEEIMDLPFMGPVTAYHLAKNIGMDVVKPDRHLERMALTLGHDSAADMCREIAHLVGDRLGVVDLVLWRFSILTASQDASPVFQRDTWQRT